MNWLFSISERLTAFFAWLIGQVQGLVPLASGAGELLALLLFVLAPAFIAFGVSRLVSKVTERSLGRTDALFTTGLFALAASAGLGTLFGTAVSIGGSAVILVLMWMFLTAAGFLFGSRLALGTMNAAALSGLILPLAVVLGLTAYAT